MKVFISALLIIISISTYSQVMEVQTKGLLNCRSKQLSLNLSTSTITLKDVDSLYYSVSVTSKRDGEIQLMEDFPLDGKTSSIGTWKFKKGILTQIMPTFSKKDKGKVHFLLSDQEQNKWEITVSQELEYFETTIYAKVWALPVWGDYNCYPKKKF